MAQDNIAIEFDDVVAGYGDFMILNNLSFAAERGKITLLLGPNGAGKSTVLKTLFGLLKVRNGRVKLFGQDITGANSKELLVQHGVAFVPQGRNLFGQLSVYENLELGGITLGMKTTHERIPEVLELFPRVKERINSAASSLSGGEQKQLEVGRALLLRPKVLLIDEPSIGLSPLVVQDVGHLLRRLAKDQGVTVLMHSNPAAWCCTRQPTSCSPTRTSSACSSAVRMRRRRPRPSDAATPFGLSLSKPWCGNSTGSVRTDSGAPPRCQRVGTAASVRRPATRNAVGCAPACFLKKRPK
jgi:branched-chain amino acid transport system ATP-binding protein